MNVTEMMISSVYISHTRMRVPSLVGIFIICMRQRKLANNSKIMIVFKSCHVSVQYQKREPVQYEMRPAEFVTVSARQ